MTDYEEIEATLNSRGAKLIFKELRKVHRNAYFEYRNCGTMDQLLNLQTLQKVIDKALPDILEKLMNKHLEPKQKKEWVFVKWLEKLLK